MFFNHASTYDVNRVQAAGKYARSPVLNMVLKNIQQYGSQNILNKQNSLLSRRVFTLFIFYACGELALCQEASLQQTVSAWMTKQLSTV